MIPIRRNAVAVMIAVVVAAIVGAPVPPPADAQLVPVDDNAWTEQLPGGPRLLLIPQRSVPMFSCTVLVPSGSALEDERTSGAAHYLEHLLFNGTMTRTREEIYALTDRLGAYNNASTQRDRTVFQLLLPSEQWRDGLELQADMLLHSVLPRSMFEKEKGILLEELAKDRSDPSYEAERFVARALWGESSRSLPVLGTEESIRNMDPETVAAFYANHYRSAGMTVLLMGDFDPVEARDEVARLYGTSEDAAPIPPRGAFPAGRRVHAAPFEDLPAVQLRLFLPMPPLAATDFAGASLLENLLNNGEHTAVAVAVGAAGVTALSASASVDAGSPWSLLTIGVDLPAGDAAAGSPDRAEPIVRAVLDHLAALVARPPWTARLQQRLNGAQADLAADFDAARRALLTDEITLREKMHYYGLMRADLLDQAGPEGAVRMLDHVDQAGDVALRLLRAALDDGRLLVTLAGPGVAEGTFPAPAGPKLAPGTRAAPAETSRESHADLPRVTDTRVTRTVFANGFTLIVHASPDSRTFAAHLLFKDRARLEEATGVPRGTADVVHRLMGLGTKLSDEAELRGRLAALGASLKVTDAAFIPYDDYYFSPEYSYVRLETIDTYGLASLDLLAEVVRTPRFTEGALGQAVEAAIARARKDEGSTRAVASADFYAKGWQGHPLAGGVYGPPDSLTTLTLDDVRGHHAAMVDPARLVLVVSSDLAPNAVAAAVRRGFESLAAPTGADSAARVERACRPNPPSRDELDLDSDQAWIVVGAPLEDVPAADRVALGLAVSLLSERLADQLREREGLAYSIGAGARLDGPGPAVTMGAGTREENLERMEAGLLEVARRFASSRPDEDALVTARNRGEGRGRMRRLSRMGQAYAMAMAELAGRDPAALDEDLPALYAVTPDDVSRVARRWLRFETPTVVIAR